MSRAQLSRNIVFSVDMFAMMYAFDHEHNILGWVLVLSMVIAFVQAVAESFRQSK